VTITGSIIIADPYPAGGQVIAIGDATTAPGSNCPAGSTDPRCTMSVNVVIPGLTIVKTANTSAAVPGQTVGYTITITNTGQTTYTAATVTDSFAQMADDAVYDNDGTATASIGTLSYTSPVLTWTGTLAPGAVATITYNVTADNPDTGDKLIINSVSSTAAGSTCPPGSVTAACRVTVPVLTPGLTIAATASAATAVPGQAVTYTVTVTDSGQTPYTGASFTDPLTGVLDDATYNGDATATPGTVVTYTSPNLTWTGDLSPGATATITFSVTVSTPDTGNHLLASTVTSPSAGSNCGSGSTDPRCSSSVTVSQLTIDSVPIPATATPGTTVDETTTIVNTGQTPYSGISVVFATTATASQVSDGGNETASSGTLSVGATGAVWTGNVPVGGTVTITGSIIIASPYPAGGQVIAITDATTAPGSNCPAGSTDPRCTMSVNVVIPGLTIVKTANTSAAVPGSVVGYTVTVTDSGQTTYSGAVVTDSLAALADDAAYGGDAVATTGTVSYAAPVLTWTGDLSPGDSATITYSVTVSNPDTGDKLLTNTVTSAAVGSTCPPGTTSTSCQVTVPVLTPALTIVAAAPAAATPGGIVTYTITVTDTGQTPYAGATLTDSLAGVLDDATYNTGATATAGTLTFTTPNLTWTGDLTVGATAVITFTVTVDSPSGNHTLTSAVTSATAGNNCPAGGTDPRCTTTTDVATLTIVNTASVATTTPGSVVAYTITITNTGQTTYTAATVTDPLAGILDDAAYNADATTTAGSIIYASPTLTWTGDLAPGAAATITFTVTVNNPDTGDQTLTSTITSAAAGSTCPATGTDPAACTATVTVLTPALTITKTANASTTTPGSTVAYTITVTDTGPTPYTAASVNDALDGVLPDAAYDNATATATAGTLSFVSPDLIWTGDLTPGQTVTISYTIIISNPDTGDKHLINIATSDDPGSPCPTGTANPSCIVTVTDLIPALTVSKTANVATTTPGSAVDYTITVADTGQTPYTAATVTDTLTGVLADATYGHDAIASTGTVGYTSPVLTWTGALDPGQTATISYSVTVSNPDAGGRFLINSAVSTATGSSCPTGSSPGCTATVAVLAGALSITVPASASLGSADPGGTASANLGTVSVTDDRGFGASWTATAGASAFTTGAGTPHEIIPAANAAYAITALSQATGSASFAFTPLTTLSTAPQAVVSTTNVGGNTTATWNPLIQVSVPATAIAGPYTGTITHSVG
jgi:uncharacterized repeat protein (TIGR01451 family)